MSGEVRHVLTILAVSHVTDVVDFYKAAFAWQVTVETPVYVEFSVPGGQRIGVYEREAFGRNTGHVPVQVAENQLAPTELYFHTDDPGSAMRRLAAAGARPLSPLTLREWGDEAAYFADPVGNVIVIARPASR